MDHQIVVTILGDIVVQDMMNLLPETVVVVVVCTEITAPRNVVTIILVLVRCKGIIAPMSAVVMLLIVIMIHHLPLDIEKEMVHWAIIIMLLLLENSVIDTYLHHNSDEM